MDREEMWVEDLEWIDADDAIDEAIGGVLVVFDEYRKVLTVRRADEPSDPPVDAGFRRIHPVTSRDT